MSISVETCRGCLAVAGWEAQVTLKPSGAGEDREPRAQTIQVPGSASFEVPDGRTWEASAIAAGYWSRPAVIGPEDSRPLAAQIELWPAGEVEGALHAAPGRALPSTLTARFQPAPGAAVKPPNAAASCRVAEGRFRCELPAGDLDLRLRARGFVTQYRWGIKVPARGLLDVGTIELKPGASLVGWVQVPGRERVEESRVEIGPQVAGAADSLAEEERRGWRREAKVNSRGFFEVDGVTPGSYRLTVRHPRLAPATVGPIGVLNGSETEVEPIQLHPPAKLEVRLHPASDPYGVRWTAKLLREGATPGSSEVVEQAAASADGRWRATGLTPGPYILKVEGSHGARWAYRSI
ncbi:MAG TPA: carboxypeptidase-like regulatory domain-containing protein, partial [Solirubrobacterales bacterium]|nr:carboxypeptidase-like regulatory domain-containing protein [Solirubrobacterales bacterium]